MHTLSLFVDNLTVIDSSVLCAQQGVSGRSWICDLVLEGGLDSRSMVMDFGQVKKRLKQVIDDSVDHKLLVPRDAAALTECRREQDEIHLSWRDAQGDRLRLRSPAQGVCLLAAQAVSAQAVADYLEPLVRAAVPDSVSRVRIALREEAIDGPCYRYSHGLKKHDGNCQRIAHGHRSRIDIRRNGEPAPDLIREWAARLDHIYVGSAEDIVARPQQAGQDYLAFAYDAPQGRFELELAARRCLVIPADSTVECIASFIAQELKRREPQAAFTVKAYEGVGKGAFASA